MLITNLHCNGKKMKEKKIKLQTVNKTTKYCVT